MTVDLRAIEEFNRKYRESQPKPESKTEVQLAAEKDAEFEKRILSALANKQDYPWLYDNKRD